MDQQIDVKELENLQRVAVDAVTGLRHFQARGRTIREVAEDLPDDKENPISAVYLIVVDPEQREPILPDVHNWWDGWAFYVGETRNLKARLTTHARTLKAVVEAEQKRADGKGDSSEFTDEGFNVSWLEVISQGTQDPVHERRLLEALIVASVSPVANDLGFGRGRRRKGDMWSLLGPMRRHEFQNAVKARGKAFWAVYDFVGADSIHLNDPLNPDDAFDEDALEPDRIVEDVDAFMQAYEQNPDQFNVDPRLLNELDFHDVHRSGGQIAPHEPSA